MVKVTEVEEGEARGGGDVDPDTALSYIGDKLQCVLGHFRKDFEQEMSPETLGPKYGYYGSFLPSYKLPPTVHSHGIALNFNKASSPSFFHLEGASAPLNPVTLVDPVKPPVGHNVPFVNDMASKDTFLVHGETLPLKSETTASKSVNPTERRSLKVRIKVGSYKPAIKKDEIYGGDPPIVSHDIHSDSPDSILRDMSSIFVPGNRLLSPLNENLICLKKPLILGRITSVSVDDSSSVECKPGLVNGFKTKPSSSSITPEANRSANKEISLNTRETQKELLKEQLFGTDSTSKDSDESYEHKNVKKFLNDSKGIKLFVCENDPSANKNETDRLEKKVALKVPNNLTKLPLERKHKLTGIKRKDNLRSSLNGAVNGKNSALKDIVKVRNSYDDILATGNGAIKVENVERNAVPAEVAVSQQTAVGPAAPPDNWVGCDRCEKWRLLPTGIEPDHLPEKWLCSMSTWLPGRNHCDIGEDETTTAVQEMNLQLISQDQDSLHFNGSRGNIEYSDHKNSNLHSEAMTNKSEKIKSRPLEGAITSLIETAHSPMDIQQHNRQKRKSLSETNQPLFEKEGDVKPKKLKSKTGSEQCETVASKRIKDESEHVNSSIEGKRPKAGLVIALKTQTESNLSDKKVEIHTKKRKLKDWQESQPHTNGLVNSESRIQRKEKSLKTEVNESSDDRCFNKGKSMKIKLSVSNENSTETNHEKDQQHIYKVTCKKVSESERFLPAATSSSSIVSGSCKRASLQERKGSPVGSVLSSPTRALNLDNISLSGGKTISTKSHVGPEISRKDIDASKKIGGKVGLKHKEASKIRNSLNMEHTTDANGAMDKPERSNLQRVRLKASDPLTGQPNIAKRFEVDASAKIVNGGKIVGKKHAGSEANLGDTISPELNPTVKRKLKKVSASDISTIRISNEKEQVQTVDRSGQSRSKIMNQSALVTDSSGALKNVNVISFLKEFASSQSQTASTAFKRAEETKDHADRLKISGSAYECNNAYIDSALMFLCAASLMETTNISKSKGMDVINVYTTSAKLFQTCAQEYEKQKEMLASALAYKCMEVACMRIVYCKNLLTRQDLQTNMQMVTQGESPSSSASDVDNLNNQATMDKTVSSKSIAHQKDHIVVRNQANFTRLLDFTSDVSLAMDASMKSRNTFKSASAVLEDAKNRETIITVKRVVNFSFQDVKEFACLVQNAREAVNRQRQQ